MPILDKTFSGVNKVIKCLILSCFHVNILYVSVALGSPNLSNTLRNIRVLTRDIWAEFKRYDLPQHTARSNILEDSSTESLSKLPAEVESQKWYDGFSNIFEDFVKKQKPIMLIPGGGMLLPSRLVINQNTGPIKSISQPSVNTLPPAAVDTSQNNLSRESSDNDISYNNYGTDLSDHDTDSLVEINNNSDNSSLRYSSGHDGDSLLNISDIPDDLLTSLDSTNISNESVISQDTELVIPIDNHPNVNTMLPPTEIAVREEPIIPEKAVVLAGIPPRGACHPEEVVERHSEEVVVLHQKKKPCQQ